MNVLLTILFICSLTSCREHKLEEKQPTQPIVELKKHSYSEPHLGTVVNIIFYSQHSKEEAAEISQKCFQCVAELNAILSDYDPSSEVSKLCSLPLREPHRVSDKLFTVISQAQAISQKTQGAFDITLGKHSKHWRNKATGQADNHESTANYTDLILDHQNKSITLRKPLMIDLGGIGKGYIADQLMVILQQSGITKAAVIIGGETVLAEAPPEKEGWHIGIEDPERNLIGKIILSNTCVSTSGDSYQFFEIDGQRRAHVIDPKTKLGKTNRLNVTTIAPTALQADAWATALRVLPIEKANDIAENEPLLEALFIPYQQDIQSTEKFPHLQDLSINNK